MNEEQYVLFMAGFPRAGTTLLMNILAQNPKFYPSPTSGLIANIINTRDNWRQNDIFRSNPEEYIYPKIKNMLKYMILGFYYDQIEQGLLPIEKNRMWTGHVDLLDQLFGFKTKILFPIRSVTDCCISMERMNRLGAVNNHGDNGNWVKEQTTRGRIENFLKDDGVFGLPILYFRELVYRNELDRLVIIPYNDLLNYPKQTLERIHNELKLPQFQYDFENIKQVITEYDTSHGFAPNTLHKIKEGKILPPNPRDTSLMVSEDIKYLDDKYQDIDSIIRKYSISP
jgi:sulfotransferase